MKPLSSRLKIALLSAAISGLLLVGFGAFLWFRVYDLRVAAVDREIRSLASRHPGLWVGRANYERLAASLEFAFGPDYTNHVIVLLKDRSGSTLYASPHWPRDLDPGNLDLRLQGDPRTGTGNDSGTNTVVDLRSNDTGVARGGRGRGFGMARGGPPPAVIFTKAPKFFTARAADSSWRVGVLGNNDVTLVVGLNHDDVQGELNHVRNAFLFTLPFALLLVGLGGWLVSGRALRPLKTIADTAERVTARGLDQRIPEPSESTEARRVIQVLNRMIDRLETSFRQATRFSADASHELKTPLTVMQGELENALHSAAPGSAEQRLFSNLLEETQRLTTITRSLLLLAQADAGQLALAREPVDFSAELQAMIEDARVLSADLRLTFDVEMQSHQHVEADRALLRMATFNLITNAIKYNEPDGRIEIRLRSAMDRIVLSVSNTGPGIPPAEQAKVFERFYRVGMSSVPRVDGIGLGLSLAREIVRAHGGELLLRESRPGWTCFEVTLLARPGHAAA